MKKNYDYIKSKIKLFFLDNDEKKFLVHNKSLFQKNIKKKKKKILVEVNGLQPNHIAISHFSKVLSEIYDAELIGYFPRIQREFFKKLKFYLVNYKIKKIFQSFGVNNFIIPDTNTYQNKAKELTKELINKVNSKKDLVNLTINDILVGDLIYDQYLASYKEPTVEIKSKKLRKILLEFSNLYLQWQELFSQRDIKAFIISHACYFMGLPARIAISFKINVYQVNLTHIYYITKDNLLPYQDLHSYKQDFEKLDAATQKKGIEEARERLKLIFEGSTDVDQIYIKDSAYSQKKISKKVLENNSQIKVLIASHSFYDSPNGMGQGLFPDFYEWLEFLGNLSNETNYEWYIKTHPGTNILDKKTIEDFVSRNNKIKLIPNFISHHQLIEEGINIVLTVHGSIGIEYAAKNITVINASLNNPHISFDFNIHPKSIKELKEIIINLDKYVNANLFSEDVYKCYFMKYLYYKDDIFFMNYRNQIKKLGHYYQLYSSKIYKLWIDYLDTKTQNKIEENLKKFILSKKYKMNSRENSS